MISPSRYGKAGSDQNYHLPVFLNTGGQRVHLYTPTSLAFQQEPLMANLPWDLQSALERKFYEELTDNWHERYNTQHRLQLRVAGLLKARIDVAYSNGETVEEAKERARTCQRLGSIEVVENYLHQLGFSAPPETKVSTDKSRYLRTVDPKWWRKTIKRTYTRTAENYLREIGIVRKNRQLYCSDLAVKWYRDNQTEQEKWLKKCILNDGCGTQLELWDVVQASLSNKANRRTELMTRIGGFERYAKEVEHEADFYTLTTPSAYHSQLSGGGDNALYEGFTVQQGQAWLSKMWARARAGFKKKGLLVYGFRIAEPHHDGTPHWHMVLFCPPSHREPVRELLRKHWLSEYDAERGAHEHRINVKRIESAKGSAAGYIAKYVAKNIDAFDVEEDFEQEGALSKMTVVRVTAWASLHGIRQFQQIGGPAVTVWRELRRLRTPTKMKTLEPIRAACDQHDWCKYIQLNGGIERGRLGRSRLWTRITGEINGYDELRGPQIAGVLSVSEAVKTRLKNWIITRRASAPSSESALLRSALGPVSITVPASTGAGSLSDPHGWTNPNETSMYGPN